MGEWVHRMLWIDLESGTGICRHCGTVPLRMKPQTGRRNVNKIPTPSCENGWREGKNSPNRYPARGVSA